MNDKDIELLNDQKAECGCYEVGEQCYDKQGEPTHLTSEDCNN